MEEPSEEKQFQEKCPFCGAGFVVDLWPIEECSLPIPKSAKHGDFVGYPEFPTNQFKCKIEKSHWQDGYLSGLYRKASQPPKGVDGHSWMSGYIEGKAKN
jgi:hypothetical protein